MRNTVGPLRVRGVQVAWRRRSVSGPAVPSWDAEGPDGLLTTGNRSQRADTLTSTQMGYQKYPEHLGRCDRTSPGRLRDSFLSLYPGWHWCCAAQVLSNDQSLNMDVFSFNLHFLKWQKKKM